MKKAFSASKHGVVLDGLQHIGSAAFAATIAFGLLLASPAHAATSTATFIATADARVVQTAANTNYATTYLRTDPTANKNVETYVKFAVAGASFPLATAKLRLYCSEATANGPAVYGTTATWIETTLNWTNKPAATTGLYDDKGAIAKNTWVEYNVQPIVTANGNVAFRLAQVGGDSVDFNSREQANPPQLVVTWDTQCAGKANGTTCTDANACTAIDSCQSNVCVGGAAPNCDDGNACTTDSCNTSTGCVHTNNTASCNADSNACTTDACSAGSCVVGAAVVCNDSNQCTSDSCNTATGACVYTQLGTCQSDTLIAKKSTWKYLDNGTNQGTAWVGTGFDDSTWKSGAGPLGYADTGIATTVSYGTSATAKYTTTYFRKSFSVADPSVYTSIAITAMRDDAMVIYLNGTEVFRSNMPDGAPTYTTKAATAVTDVTYHEQYIDPSLLLTGNNVISAEVHLNAANSAGLAFDMDLTRRCPLLLGDARIQAQETLCDGVDNDCDGLTDVLLPNAANACSTGQPGACGSGFATCMYGTRTCLAPTPVAETKDGIDNDCNGATDDAYAGTAKPVRARVVLAPSMGGDAPAENDGAIEALKALGVPFDAPNLTKTTLQADWDLAMSQLNNYTLILMPGYLIGEVIPAAQMTALTNWVSAGGVLIWMKPSDAPQMAFAGLATTTQRVNTTDIRVAASNPGTLFLDSKEERDILISTNATLTPEEVFTYTLAGTDSVGFGVAYAGATSTGPTFVRRPYGSGAVYTLGFDPLNSSDPICYINCFDPGHDLMTQIVRGAFREAQKGHFVLKHSVPGTESSVVMVTHDLCAPDAQNAGTGWGTAGALRMAAMEVGHNVKATYLDTTDYVTGYYNTALPGQLCGYGMCPEASHSVQHVNETSIAYGVCNVTQANYNTASPTLCGETVVSMQLLMQQLSSYVTKIRAWRAPFLGVNGSQYDMLATQGVEFDSSYATGDVRSNYPVSVARYPTMQYVFHAQPIWTFPITLEDGIGTLVNGVEGRIELQRMNQPWFLTNWRYAMLQNRANHAWTVQLVHPSYGVGVGYENLPVKIESVSKYLDTVQQYDVYVSSMLPLGDFWKARELTDVTASYDPVAGYTGSIKVGALPITRFALEFGDNLTSFTCTGGGTPGIVGTRVVLPGTLAANTTYTFTAKGW